MNIIDEIKLTYADNQDDGKSFNDTKGIRRLEWRADELVQGDMIETALKATGAGYNDFEPISVSKTILNTDPQAKVFVAREGSVCLYIITQWPTDMIRALNASEGDLQGDGTVRIWWD